MGTRHEATFDSVSLRIKEVREEEGDVEISLSEERRETTEDEEGMLQLTVSFR